MTVLRLILLAGALALAAAIVWAVGADDRGLGPVLAEMLSEPWTIVTLIDLYLGFFIGAVVIFLFEKSWPARLFWAAPVFFLGNVWTALWLLIRLPEIVRCMRGG
ncbi:MAG: DUF1475 family protein [Pseudomonadota bacterium]